MRHQVSGKKLGRTYNQRKSLFRTQLRQLFTNGALETTLTKSKIIKTKAEKLLQKSKEADLNVQRDLQVDLGDRELVQKTVTLAKKLDRTSGFIKAYRLGSRRGDNAVIVRLELTKVEEPQSPVEDASKAKKESKKVEKKDDKKAKKVTKETK
jgi:large subunit ribosomal protein L17